MDIIVLKISNRKGVFFTAMAIIIISLLVASYTFYSYVQERKVIQKRIETMNNFILSIENDLTRKMFISGFRAIFVFNNKIIDTGSYISNVTQGFQELFFNGTFLGQQQQVMNGAKFSDIANDFNFQGNKININVSITNSSVSIAQMDPWNVNVTLIAYLLIKDKNNLASWNKTIVSSELIPIYHFEDPVYLLNTGGIITTKINQTSYSSFTPENLLNHTQNQYYIQSTDAPSFLDRLEGKINADSQFGIESLVNTPRLSTQGINVLDKSIVDHIYFSLTNPPYCQVAGMPTWFKLDTASLSRYNVNC